MEHRLRLGEAGGGDGFLSGLFAYVRKKSLSAIFQAFSMIFGITFGPALFVLVLVITLAPEGGRGSESHAIYWILASIALGAALVSGFATLTWATRLIMGYTSGFARESIEQYQPQVLEDMRDSRQWIQNLPVVEDCD